MSYTMTIEAPEQAAQFEQLRCKFTQAQLGALFVAFLAQQEAALSENENDRSVSAKIRSLRGIVNLPDDFVERKVLCQREALLSVAGGWQDSRSQDEIIADIESHRTPHTSNASRGS